MIKEDDMPVRPHAFHLNLPNHHMDGKDGLPFITKFAQDKARMIVRLAHSIQLTEALYINEAKGEEEDDIDMIADPNNVETRQNDGNANAHAIIDEHTLNAITKKCTRLQSQLSTLESLKHSGITQRELCLLILHILRIVSATVTFEYDESNQKKKAILHYENVGYIWNGTEEQYENVDQPQQLEDELRYTFALPSPAREALLSVVTSIMSKKSCLRGVSNASLYPEPDDKKRFLLILHWQALLRTLLRTCPYLDEGKWANPPKDSNSRQNTIQKRTVQLIRLCRKFFDQGVRPYGTPGRIDATARDIWDMVKDDLLLNRHTHAFYRGIIMIYLFQPTKCSPEYYLELMPKWFDCWTSLDRCLEIDFLWLVLFCRARKHLSQRLFDWGPIRRRLLTHSQYWLQIPIGGASMDSTFPRALNPRSRSCPSRLKAFVGTASPYEEGIDFVAKVAKLLVINIGANPPGIDKPGISEGTADILRMLHFVTPYFNPSNIGTWTFTLGAFLHYLSYEVCHRVGIGASLETLKDSQPKAAEALLRDEPYLEYIGIPPKELVVLLDALLPLCQQALYSKNGNVGRAGEAALVYLAQIDPVHVTPPFLDFATRALDISAVNLAHQAPAALSALTRLIQPSLRRQPSILLSRLPELLRLSLAGIDSNDQNKTIRTLILYRNLTSWIPVGSIGRNSEAAMDTSSELEGSIHLGANLMRAVARVSESEEYLAAMKALPATSILSQPSMLADGDDVTELLYDEANSAMADWVLSFLDRIYDLLRATGEREKSGKTASGVASRHSSSDVEQARNFSRIIKECLSQVFCSMDEQIHKQAVRSVAQFLQEETLPSAAKDAAALCQAVCAARSEASGVIIDSLAPLVQVLTDDLERQSNKTLTYRIRCLAGAVRSAGKWVYYHRDAIARAISIALDSKDKHVFKMGCKLLRHTLASQSDSYPISTSFAARTSSVLGAGIGLGRSAELAGDRVEWHIPDGDQVEFVFTLLWAHVMQPIANLKTNSDNSGMADLINATGTTPVDVSKLRRCLKVIRYALRGGSAMLLDLYDAGSEDDQGDNLIPHERAVQHLLQSGTDDSHQGLLKMRKQICAFVVMMSSIIASETVDSEKELNGTSGTVAQQNYLARASSDTKICKEVSEIAMLLLTRRGAQFRCQEGKTIWKSQKQLVSDFALCCQADHMSSSMQRAGTFVDSQFVIYKDGEDGGKAIPRRLLVTRIQLFYESIQRNSSFETPRRLRRHQQRNFVASCKLFTASTTMNAEFNEIEKVFDTSRFTSLDGYEGMLDGLFALSCHSNTQARAAGIGVVDYAVTRFGWLVRPRVPRLLSALTLKDDTLKGVYGIPSCSQLSNQLDNQGKRRRMAEVMKGVCSLLHVGRTVKELMASEKSRLSFVHTLCETDSVIAKFPTEEMQKMVHYYQGVFNPFRSKYYSLPRTNENERILHEQTLTYLLNVLRNEGNPASGIDKEDAAAPHWRRRLLAAWFLTCFTDYEDLRANRNGLCSQLWRLCFQLLENEVGQPLQRMALGLFGRLLSLALHDLPEEFCSSLKDNLKREEFCKVMSHALVYDHREDSSVGGGHDAQWSAGVEDLIRDAGRNVAPKSLFPFTRSGPSSGVFKTTHAQLVELMVVKAGVEGAHDTAKLLLCEAKVLAAAPPNEDQRNQQVTSAEIFAGVSRALLILFNDQVTSLYKSTLLPFLEEVVPKIPISIAGAYFDAFRFGIQFCDSKVFLPLTSWVVENIESSLWQSTGDDKDDGVVSSGDPTGQTSVGSEGFTLQSKYLYLASSLLVELEAYIGVQHTNPWYTSKLTKCQAEEKVDNQVIDSCKAEQDKLLRRLLSSVGHPYENCRDHIAGCLFRIYNCEKRRQPLNGTSQGSIVARMIVDRLAKAGEANGVSSKERYNTLITARKFISYCIYLGDVKSDFGDLILPLLPMTFETLQTTVESQGEGQEEVDPALRALEAEVFKGYRYTVAEISVSCVLSYGNKEEINSVLDVVKSASKHQFWQVRQGAAHFLRCFEGCHKFLFSDDQARTARSIIASLLADERREVSSAAMSALTGILAATPDETVASLVDKYVGIASRSRIKKARLKKGESEKDLTQEEIRAREEKEKQRTRNQQTSVFFLCAAILAEPYDTPPYAPVAIAAVSKHSFEKSAPLGVRDIVKKCCGEFKRTHMSDNWEVHRNVFSQEQLECLEDVVSTPHYYA